MNRDFGTYVTMKAMVTKGYLDLKRLQDNTVNARQKNEKLLFRILKAGENSKYGKKYDFKNIKSVEEYRKKVPLSTYDDYVEYVERMINNNEEDLLTSFPLIGYSQTSGTTGKPKFIPLTQNIASLYQRYTLTIMLAMTDRYCREKYGRSLKPGRGIFICVDFDEKLPNGRSATNVPETTAKQLGFLYPYLLNVPYKKLFRADDISAFYLSLRFALEDRNTMYIFSVFFSMISEMLGFLEKNWKLFVDDIENGTINDAIGRPRPEIKEKILKDIKPNPERANELRKEFEKGFDETIIKRIWPNMSVIYGISGSIYTGYANNVRKITKDIPFDCSIYGASEGLFATPNNLDVEKRLLVVDSCYFEFIPLDDESKILSLDELELGKEYEIVITNQAGLYRYRIADVIRVEGFLNQCPYISFSHRKGHLLSICGEKTTEQHLMELINRISQESGVEINEWFVYINTDTHPAHYTLAIENESEKDLSSYAEMADKNMCEISPIYKRFRHNIVINPMTVANLKKGTFAEWKKSRVDKGTAPTQVKPVRVLDNEEKFQFFTSHII